MNFIEAITAAKEDGVSITPSHYSSEAQNRVQFYFNLKGKFVSQDADLKPRDASLDSTKISGEWLIFPGDYEQREGRNAEEYRRYLELKEEISPLYNKFSEYKRLKSIYS